MGIFASLNFDPSKAENVTPTTVTFTRDLAKLIMSCENTSVRRHTDTEDTLTDKILNRAKWVALINFCVAAQIPPSALLNHLVIPSVEFYKGESISEKDLDLFLKKCVTELARESANPLMQALNALNLDTENFIRPRPSPMTSIHSNMFEAPKGTVLLKDNSFTSFHGAKSCFCGKHLHHSEDRSN